jgi:hypothetical protein
VIEKRQTQSSATIAYARTWRHATPSRLLSAGALAVRAPWPAAGPTLTFLQLLLGPANATFSGHLLLGVLNPANELVTGQRSDDLPRVESRGVGYQRFAQVSWKLVHHATRHSRAAHEATVPGQSQPCHHPSGPDRNIKNSPSPKEDRSPGRTRRRADRLLNVASPPPQHSHSSHRRRDRQ